VTGFLFCTFVDMSKNIELRKGDITKLEVDAIVNAANSSLLGGGGVDGAIHRAGGPAILDECMKIRQRQGGCKIGEAVITTGGRLPCKYVIHTVGPVWNGGNSDEERLLENAYRNSMRLAAEHGVQSIAFPNISTGIYRFPKEKAATIAHAIIKEILAETMSSIKVFFVCFDEENYRIYASMMPGDAPALS
jgi:O-acetyl-ADP-ribose deacetylase (regulator of RNase III)